MSWNLLEIFPGIMIRNQYYNSILYFSIVETDNRITDRCRAWCSIAGIPYYRFSPYMATDIEMDEKDDKILIDFMWNTMAYVYSRKEDVIRLKEILLN